MFVFAILYFGVMTDAGLLDPIVDRILRGIGTRPRRVVMGAALLALLVASRRSGRRHVPRHHSRDAAALRAAEDGQADPALRDLHGRRRQLPAVDGADAAGVGRAVHTGGRFFWPLIPVQIVGLVFVFGVAFMLGTREERRLRHRRPASALACGDARLTPEQERLRRPGPLLDQRPR